MEDLNIINEDPIFIQHMTEEDDREAICIAKYKKEFIEEGIEQGIEQGKLEGAEQEKYTIATNLLKKGFDINMISDATGLSIQELEKIDSKV